MHRVVFKGPNMIPNVPDSITDEVGVIITFSCFFSLHVYIHVIPIRYKIRN